MGQSRDPSPLSPDQIREAASALPERDVEADTIREVGQELPERTIDPDSIRSVAEQLPSSPAGERVQEDEGDLFDDLAGLALSITPRAIGRDLTESAQQGEPVGGVESAVEGTEAVLSEMGRKFFRGRSQEALDRARAILAERPDSTLAPEGTIKDPSLVADDIAGSDAEAARQAVELAQKRAGQAEQFEGAPSVRRFSRQLQEGDTRGAVETAIESPQFLPALGLGTLAQQPDAIAAGAGLTALAGAAAPAGVASTLAAGAAGGGSSFLSANIVESRAETARALREAGADLSDTEDVMSKLQDESFREEVEERIDKRVAAIGTVDALANLATMGMANSAMSRPITALLSAGAETAAEGAGEAAAQATTDRPIQPADIALETLAGFVPGTIEAGTQIAAGGDGATQQARTTNEIAQEIRRRAEQVTDDRARAAERMDTVDDGAPARPLRDMDESDLRSAREEALDNADTETVQLIDEELQAREREEAEDTESATNQQQGAGEATRDQERTDPESPAASGVSGGRPRTPSPVDEQKGALRALDAIERARQVAEEQRQAREELGLGQIPEDPAPEIDARRDETETDERPSEPEARPSGDEAGAEGDPVAPDDEPAAPEATARDRGDATDTPQASPEATEEGPEGAAGGQGELAPDMGVRPETRPEEQVGEAVEETRERVRQAEAEVQETEQKIESALSDADPETLQRLAEQTESERARQQLRAELERRGGTESLFGEAQPQTGAEQDLFGQQGAAEAESTSGLERLVRRLEQREAGLEQAREELLRRREQEAERREQAREAQQELDVDQDAEADGDTRDAGEADEDGGRAEGTSQDQADAGDDRGVSGADRAPAVDYTPPYETESGTAATGRLTLTRETEEGVETTEATVTEDAVQAPAGTSPATLRRLADEAGKRDKALETAESVSPETAQSLYRLAQEGYEVVRASSAAQTDVGVEADGEPAFRIRAPRLEDTAPQVETEQGVTMGRAAQGVTRETAQSPRSDAFSNTETAELREQLEQATEEGNEQEARRLREELQRRQNPPTQTTYRHEPGDLVAVDEDGRFIDRRAGEKYEEALAQYFAEHDAELREGDINPGSQANYTGAVARSSDSPVQVLDAYLIQRSRVEDEGANPAEDMMDANRYSTASFDEYADPNWRQDSGQVTMNWLGGEKALDDAAQSITEATGIETTPQDIVDHIMEHPGGPNRKSDAERTLGRLAERFERLTGTRLTPDLAERLKDAQTEELREDLEEDPEVDNADDVFSPTGDAPFQRLEEQEGRAEASALVEVYLRVIANELGAGDVTVVQTPAELNGEAATAYERGRKRAGDDFSQPAMFFDPPDGEPQVYVIASDLEANARAMGMDLKTMARATLMHEVVAHKGLRGLLGEEFEATMEQLYDAIGRGRLLSTKTADGTPLADAYAPELETGPNGELTAESKRLLVEEYLARLAEDMAAPETLLQRIWRTIRDAIQRVFSTRITRSELRLLLDASRDHLRGRQARNEVSGTRFDRRANGSVPAARWMMVGTGARDFDRAQAEGRTFEGLEGEPRLEISDADARFNQDGPFRQYVESGRSKNNLEQRLQSTRTAPDELIEKLENAEKRRVTAEAELKQGVNLNEALRHDQLYEQYPFLARVTVRVEDLPPFTAGAYEDGDIVLNLKRLNAVVRANLEDATARLEDLIKTLLHEIQHVIQQEEGFSLGDSPHNRLPDAEQRLETGRTLYGENRSLAQAQAIATIMDAEDVSAEEATQIYESDQGQPVREQALVLGQNVFEWDPAAITSKIAENNEALRDLGFKPRTPLHRDALEGDESAAERWKQNTAKDLYRRSAGEIEARLTQERRDVPQEERFTETEELRQAVDYNPEEIVTRFARRQENPDQLELFHDPESGQADVPGGKRNMVVLHNLDDQNIRFAVEQMDGYLPVPSLATVRYEEGLDNFGDITLLGSPDLVDPEEGVPTFGGDAYTPTTPGPAYEGDMDAWLETDLQTAVDKWGEILDRSIGAGITAYVRSGDRDKFYQRLSAEPEGLLAFLEQQGETITREDLPRKEYDGFMADYIKQDPLADLLEGLTTAELNRLPYAVVEDNEAYDPELSAELTLAYEEAAREKAEEITDDDAPEGRVNMKYRVLRTLHLDDSGMLPFAKIDQMVKSWRRMQEEPRPIDVPAVKEQAREQVMEVLGVDDRAEMRKELESYWREQVDPFSEPRMPGDTSKRYNLYNIVERMREMGVRAAEGTGVNFLRALTIERFGSVEEMQQMRDRLTSREEYKQAASRLEDQVERVWDKLKWEHDLAERGTHPRRDVLHDAVADYVARPDGYEHAKDALSQNGFESVPADKVHAFMELVTQLQREPVQYFESKPQRAVALSEFEAAIVPDDAPADVREMLAEEVGRVAEYEAGSDAARQEVLAEESARADVRFQRQQPGEDAAETGADTPPNPNALTADWSPSNLAALAKKEFRRWFQQRSLLPESVWRAKLEKDGALAAGHQRVRYALRDFGEALEAVYDTQNPDPTVVERLNEALQNGRRADLRPEQGELFAGPQEDDPDAGPTQANLFGTDPPMGPTYDEGEQALSEMTFIEDLPEPVREAMDQLRTHIDTLSRLAIKSGLYRGPLKVVVQENMGTYVTRQYRTHNEDGYAETVKQAVRDYAGEDLEIDPDDVPESLNIDPDVWNRAVGYMRSEFPGMSEKQILGRLFELLTTEDEGPLIEGGSTLGSVGESIYKRRENIPTALRELMGEYKDPRENYLNSMQKMLRGVTNQKFLNQVKQAGLGDWLRQEPVVEEGTEYTEEIAAEGSRTMQPLNGLYTTKEIKQAFEEFENEGARRSALFRHYMKAVSFVKANLTVFSFTLQMRNYLSAFLFGLSQGHWFDTSTLFSAYKEAHSLTYNRVFEQQDEEAQRQFTQKLLRLGVLDESPRAGEMRDLWRDAGGMLEDPIEGQESLATRIAKGVPRKAERLYRAGDNVHKIAGFIIEKARYEDAYPNKSEQEIDEIAAERVRNGFPTYSLVPKVIRQLRRNPFVASFPSFFAEVVRNRYNTLRFIKEDLSDPRTRQIGIKRALGEITSAAMWTSIASVGAGLADMWDLDDEARRFLPSWEKYSYLYFLPSEEGEFQFVDLGYLNPNAMFHEPVLAMLGGEDIDLEKAAWTAGYRAMEPFISKEILTRAVVEALNNRSLEDGDPIANPQLPAREQLEMRASHVGKEMVPRVFRTVQEGYGAWMGGEEGLGRDGPTKMESIISPLLGQNIRTVEMGNAFKWKVINLENKYRDAGSIWYSTLTKRGTVSRPELEEAYRQSLQAKKRLIEKAHKDAVAAQQLGLTPGQVASIMQSQRIDERLIMGVLNGRFRPRIDGNVLQGRIRQEMQAGNTKNAQILRERQQIARRVMQKVAAEFRRPNDEEATEATREQLQNQ